ncbi:helix-turn-helix transcriptional regulator [Cognatiyoonia sp. IB215182]|uniref:helix-turn-helix transcriptional regulator n=1 Tax=Cognatiyoonia sp. IB215182 TaxID=3097353 RepID=UPI002A0AFD6F|nr:helix-turn-helix transcriptional regulator [Cognatiyoonia sp. IB215182]MDX8354304.1 helix-turn-helix transcriptional regulator [Cognatiyoonia sp. IB215182]
MIINDVHRELIESLERAATAEQKAAVTRGYCAGHGFTQFFYGFVSYPDDIIDNNGMFHTTFNNEVWDLHAEGGGIQNDPIATRINEIHLPEVMDNTAIARDEKFSDHPLTDYFLGSDWNLGVIYPFKSIGGIGALTAFADNGSRREQVGIVEQGLRSQMIGLAGLFHEAIVNSRAAHKMFSMTDKERDALAFVAAGYTISDLADHLMISERAVEKRLFRARRKLGAKNTANAVYRAAVRGII